MRENQSQPHIFGTHSINTVNSYSFSINNHGLVIALVKFKEMATAKDNTTISANANTTLEFARPLANFPPSAWGDHFLSFSLDNSKLEAYGKAMGEPKEDLRRLIINHTIDSNAKLSLIYSLYRLGLAYLFKEEIREQLEKLFNELKLQDYHDIDDLYTISIHFQVFRLHGYKVSCDVFNKFMDSALGAFKEDITTDVRGMLAFYESTQLRIRGEYILDEAFTFTEAKLKNIEKTLEGNLLRQVKRALSRPLHRGMPIVEARFYLLNYEEECSVYDSLLKLANAHFEYLQLLHNEELRIISQWWKDMSFHVITPFARDRVPELYMWILGLSFEPYYSQARIMTTKIITFVCVLDDTCDAYSTIEEFRLFTHAINRWEASAMEELPEYMKPFYKIILDEYAGFEEQLAKEGRENVIDSSKQAFKNLAKAYLEEAEWRLIEKVPPFEDYTKNGVTTSSYDLLSISALMGMGKIATEEALTWYKGHPDIMKTSGLIGRLRDDLVSFEFERERGSSITSIEAYIKTYGVSETEAVEGVKKIIENAWKDINDGCLQPREVEMDVLAPIVNLAKMSDVTYQYNDGFTFPETFKEYITLLLIAPVHAI
ncbi:hypothetical protein OSB04_012506 [Centaurea solstitialis]|uniref:Uncharacterized protein n=1 Tax=Centaurea solstitialis TaxID=347529 RepID=A0AA38TUJ6_9ASTR|nr:hypothetical protein OSB04_012506 [Centaurea solstitialis]